MGKQFLGDHELAWLDFGIEIISVPTARISLAEQRLYQFFFDSGLICKADHIDRFGQPWLCVQHDASSYESLAPLPGSYRQVPSVPYPVLRLKDLPDCAPP